MPAEGAREQREQRVLRELLREAATYAPAEGAWGPNSAPPLRVVAGAYVARRRERLAATAALLSIAELFGLPPFLRSIRAAGGAKSAGGRHDAPLQLFPNLADLDPRVFDVPAPGHAPVAQEELVDIACTHARFGAVFGEADQIAALLRAGAGATDPLRPFAQALAQKDAAAARWICGNQWNPSSVYYALVFVAVAPPTDALSTIEENSEEKEAEAEVAYYVAAVLELARLGRRAVLLEMLRDTGLCLGGYMKYHRRAMGTMKYSRWKGAHGGIGHFYGRTPMIEEVKANEPITLIDRRIMHYVHRSRLRHFQLFRSYQQKSNSTECKLHEGEMLRRRWHRRLQKSFISFMQFKTMKVLEEQAKLVNTYGQASVNAALGDPWNADTEAERDRKYTAIRRKVRALPTVNVVPKHVATMKQIHNDRFNYRWRVN